MELLGADRLFQTQKNYPHIFSESELRHFFNSIRRSSAIAKIGYSRSYARLEKIELRIQWPVWKKILKNNLVKEIFPEEGDLIGRLAQLLELEDEALAKKKPAHVLRWLIHERIKLYPKLFKYDAKDKEWVEKKSLIHGKRMDLYLNRGRNKKIAVAGTILGGAAAIYAGAKIYQNIKENKEKNEKEEKDKKK